MVDRRILTWGSIGAAIVRDIVALTAGPTWCVRDLLSQQTLGPTTFDARDALRDCHFASVIALGDGLTDTAVMLAAVQALLASKLNYLIVVTSQLSATRKLLSLGEPDEMLAVLAALDKERIRLWERFDAHTFGELLDRAGGYLDR